MHHRPKELDEKLARLYRADEAALAQSLCEKAQINHDTLVRAQETAAHWIDDIRTTRKQNPTGVHALLTAYGLEKREGIALMCLAEALLRIPDAQTADALIKDKLTATDFDLALGAQAPWLARATGWALNMTGHITGANEHTHGTAGAMLNLLNNKLGHSAAREAIKIAMRWLGDHFVIGDTINAALKRADALSTTKHRFSFDMLGEGARGKTDAEQYIRNYHEAIAAIADYNQEHDDCAPCGISIKLSALHPRYEYAQRQRVIDELVPVLVTLCEAAAKHNMPLTIDAEEADRLALSLDVIQATLERASLGTWQGLGLAVQAYSKRAPAVIDIAAWLAETFGRKLHIRLVKGAYWDSEIKRAQERGWTDFPVYTRKETTDVAYIACAKKILSKSEWLTPVFGTHNALTAATILAIAPDPSAVEFQVLQGMGEDITRVLQKRDLRTCVYAPVGAHKDLLAYLVRRMLENGANSSFVHQITDDEQPISSLVQDPVAKVMAHDEKRHPAIALPHDLYAPKRLNSCGVDLTDPADIAPLQQAIDSFKLNSVALPDHQPLDKRISDAQKHLPAWQAHDVHFRASALERVADRLTKERSTLVALLVHEAGKTIADAVAEIREAVDFCRYYAHEARANLQPLTMPSYTGEKNILHFNGRGIFACISPWNFPLAIFLGQSVAALVAGNAVLAKPAPQTPLIASYIVQLAYEEGIPEAIFQLVIGDAQAGAELVAHKDIAGVAFTGSAATARAINRALAAKDGAIIPLIAETGGQNAIIADSSALVEQLVDDVIASAFKSAGQRCSAARILCLPYSIADKVIGTLCEALQELQIGNPAFLSTDIGPVIDKQAHERLSNHLIYLKRVAKEIYVKPLPTALPSNGTHCYFSPQIWEIPNISYLSEEVFGPILHIVRYHPHELPNLIDQINATGYALTAGMHSRIEHLSKAFASRIHAGNVYINRNIVGAIVGTQPFGGNGLSGTGPKAGGPLYLHRFVQEKTITVNTVASGGNAHLLALASGDGTDNETSELIANPEKRI